MRFRAVLITLLLVVTVAGCDPSSVSSEDDRDDKRTPRRFGPAQELGRLSDPRITEASGIAASRGYRNVYWVHNDSGGGPEIFCVKANGISCGTVTISEADAIDWEDIAAGPDGTLYIGDIGDNQGTRDSVDVYRVTESEPPGTDRSATWSVDGHPRFRYPGGSFDAEALMVHPQTGAIYIVTKASPALVLRGAPEGGRMKVVGALRLPGLLSLVTAADFSPDGEHAIIGTYDRAFELTARPGRPFDSIWRAKPRPISLPIAPQREAIAYTVKGDAIVSTSEGKGAALVQRKIKGS